MIAGLYTAEEIHALLIGISITYTYYSIYIYVCVS